MTKRDRKSSESRFETEWAELERALETPPPPAPAHFTERVMARVAAMRPEARTRGAEASVRSGSDLAALGGLATPALDWWVRAAADPAAALALVLAALLLWRAEALVPVARVGSDWLTAAWRAASPPTFALSPGAIERWMPHGVVALALALALMPALAWGSWRLYLWAERASLLLPRPPLTQH